MNQRDAFSHSGQCDQFFSVISPIVGGIEHQKCRCWCHTTEHLFSSSEPEYDLTPPPEYAGSADAAFALDEPAHVRVGFSLINRDLSGPLDPAMPRSQLYDPVPYVAMPDRSTLFAPGGPNGNAADLPAMEPIDAQATFPNRSRRELTSGKCDTCGDPLADCECVE